MDAIDVVGDELRIAVSEYCSGTGARGQPQLGGIAIVELACYFEVSSIVGRLERARHRQSASSWQIVSVGQSVALYFELLRPARR